MFLDALQFGRCAASAATSEGPVASDASARRKESRGEGLPGIRGQSDHSNWCIANGGAPLLRQGQNACERNTAPGGAIVEFVEQLVKGLLQEVSIEQKLRLLGPRDERGSVALIVVGKARRNSVETEFCQSVAQGSRFFASSGRRWAKALSARRRRHS